MVIALILAAVAAGMVYLYLQQLQVGVAGADKGPVVIASSDIPEKTRITRSMVKQVEMPVDYIHPRAARNLNDVVGAIASQPLVAGEQIILNRVVKGKETEAGLSYLVPQGKRAVTIAVDEVSAVGWNVRPGDHVDIIGTIEVPMPVRGSSGERETRVITVVALQDVEVLAVGTDTEIVKDQGKEKEIKTKTVTLAVTLDEAKPLVLADEEGKIRMALRSPLERGKVFSSPFELEDFLYLDTVPEGYHKQH